MRYVLRVAAMAAVMWIGTTNFAQAQGFGWAAGGCAPSSGDGFGGYTGPFLNAPTPAQASASPAKLYVTLPADAKLTIDGCPTVSTSALRIFESPRLTPGKTFCYVLKATVVRGGKTGTVTKKVAVRAGAEVQVKLEIPEAVAAND